MDQVRLLEGNEWVLGVYWTPDSDQPRKNSSNHRPEPIPVGCQRKWDI